MTAGPVLAADVGGTQMRAALVGPEGDVLLRRSFATPEHADVPAALIDLIRDVGAERGHGAASHAVVGLPGGVDYEHGRLMWAPHLPEGWPDRLSRDELSVQLGLPAHIANDADLAAVGEAAFGAGAGTVDVAYLTISTGIGAGVVLGGRLLRGTRSLAEVGHTVIDWHAWRERLPCTLEELGSGSGVARIARETGLTARNAQEVAAAAAAGEAGAIAIWQGAIAACAAGVSNLVMSFYPSLVVVGGGLGRREEFFGPLRDMVLSRPEHHPADLAMLPAALGDDAGLAGAAAWVAATGP
ncbi:MAG TPA: ROK family protein [Acidimicrobiales bacterium]|nr:ROK family protein [Acidimicrobiales bacterium]